MDAGESGGRETSRYGTESVVERVDRKLLRLFKLTPEPTNAMTSLVTKDMISARMSYRDQFPSDANPPRLGICLGRP